jgi:hypothetical protein
MLVLFSSHRDGSLPDLRCQVCQDILFPCTFEYLAALSIKGEPHEAMCSKCGGNPDNPPSLKVLRARPLPGPRAAEKEMV